MKLRIINRIDEWIAKGAKLEMEAMGAATVEELSKPFEPLGVPEAGTDLDLEYAEYVHFEGYRDGNIPTEHC